MTRGAPAQESSTCAYEYERFRVVTAQIVASVTLALIGATWRLWFPVSSFPQVPLLSAALAWPVAIDWCASGALVVVLCTVALRASERLLRIQLLFALAVTALLVVTNQHRLQPWAYHFALSAWALAMLDAARAKTLLRWLLISIYLYSAASKFDLRFAETTGSAFISAAFNLLQLDADHATTTRAAFALPLGELFVAILLVFKRTRRWGVALALALHAVLLLLLSPLGMNQRWGVLIWNIGCMLQVAWLFGRSSSVEPAVAQQASIRLGGEKGLKAALALPLVVALVLPLFEPIGRCDSWLAWGLYSTRAARTELYIAADAVGGLPEELQRYCSASKDGIWSRVSKSRWSLESVRVPLYPHERFDMAVDLAILEQLPAEKRWFQVRRASRPDRRSGKSDTTMISAETELRERVRQGFAWNAVPRAAAKTGSLPE